MSTDNHQVRIPSTVTLKDLVYFGTIVVAITTSFLLYGTRLSVVEQQMLTVGHNIVEIKQDIKEIIQDEKEDVKELSDEIRDLQDRQKDLENNQSRIEWLLNEEDEGG